MIPRFKTLDALAPDALRAHLTGPIGAIIVEKFLGESLAGLDRKDFLGDDPMMRNYVIANRLGNSEEMIRRVSKACFGSDDARATLSGLRRIPWAEAVNPILCWPYQGMPEEVRRRQPYTVPLSARAYLFLSDANIWSSAPVFERRTIDVGIGDLLIAHGNTAIGFTKNLDTDSRVILIFDIVPRWLTPPK